MHGICIEIIQQEKKKIEESFPHDSVVKILPANAWDASLILVWDDRTYAMGQLSLWGTTTQSVL